MPQALTGTIINASRVFYRENNVYTVTGYLYGDTKKRWEDGTSIQTSIVISEENGLVVTLNSTYKIHNWVSVEDRLYRST